jgi:general secretion pathway protein G
MRTMRKRAFTLLEVLMVVIIIGLLAVFVVPQFFGTQLRTEIRLTQAKIDSGISGTLDRYKLDMGAYPTTDEGLKALIEKPDNEELAKKWGGPYLKDVGELKDAWDNELIYQAPGNVNSGGYDLSSAGPDKQPNTDDDLTNWKKTN